jgi:hypothetical protein
VWSFVPSAEARHPTRRGHRPSLADLAAKSGRWTPPGPNLSHGSPAASCLADRDRSDPGLGVERDRRRPPSQPPRGERALEPVAAARGGGSAVPHTGRHDRERPRRRGAVGDAGHRNARIAIVRRSGQPSRRAMGQRTAWTPRPPGWICPEGVAATPRFAVALAPPKREEQQRRCPHLGRGRERSVCVNRVLRPLPLFVGGIRPLSEACCPPGRVEWRGAPCRHATPRLDAVGWGGRDGRTKPDGSKYRPLGTVSPAFQITASRGSGCAPSAGRTLRAGGRLRTRTVRQCVARPPP